MCCGRAGGGELMACPLHLSLISLKYFWGNSDPSLKTSYPYYLIFAVKTTYWEHLLLKFPMPKAFLPCCMVENTECDVCMCVCIYVCRSGSGSYSSRGLLAGKQFPLTDNLCIVNWVGIRWLSVIYDDTDHMLIHFLKRMSVLFAKVLLPKSKWIDFQWTTWNVYALTDKSKKLTLNLQLLLSFCQKHSSGLRN